MTVCLLPISRDFIDSNKIVFQAYSNSNQV